MAEKKSASFILSFLLLCTIVMEADAASPRLARPNCTESCGNISIPFPFGIGSRHCFLDDWYEIECRQNNAIAFLKKINMQVLNVSLPDYYSGTQSNGIIRINFPIAFSSAQCSGKVINASVSLEGSQFIFSQTKNVFRAVGCDATALLNRTEYDLVGCKASCKGGTFNSYSTCSGFDGCCKITIPFGLNAFNVEFSHSTGIDDQQCSNYAVIADQKLFQNSTIDLDALKINGFLPAILEWGISNATDTARLLSHFSSYQEGYRHWCTNHSLTSYDDIVMPFLQCVCSSGYVGNPYLIDGCQDIDECQEYPDVCPGRCVNKPGSFDCVKEGRKLAMIGIGFGVGALLSLLGICWLYKTTKKGKKLKAKYFKQNGGLLLQQHLSSPEGSFEKIKLFNEKELEKATNSFHESRVLGKGGQGMVFKGILADGRIIAVKKAVVVDKRRVEQFINEVIILSQINHRNIVKLLGCCLETEFPLLVYEFIPNGALYDYLHDSKREIQMSWEMRLQLATEIASALSYLHSAASTPIYHRDIKSTNILLDEKYRAKVADFGISKTVSLDQTHVTTLVQGTFGYLDPEYFHSSQFTDKSDVYSFGVVLVELLTGEKPISSLRAEEGRSLATYFVLSVEEGHLFDILGAEVAQGKEEEIIKVANLAKRCLYANGRNRPTMKEVVMELEGIKGVGQLSHMQQNIGESEPIQNLHDASTSRILKQDANVAAPSDVESLLSSGTW